MFHLKSKVLTYWYGDIPNEYHIKFIHYNIEFFDESNEEYENIKEDLENIYNYDKEAFKLYFSNINDYLKLSDHIDLNKYEDKIYIRIRSNDEYKKLIENNISKNIKVIVFLSDLEKIDIKDSDLVVQVDKVSELPLDKLNDLLTKYNIKEVSVGQFSRFAKEYEHFYDNMGKYYHVDPSEKLKLEQINSITNDIYSVDDYKKILNKFYSIIEELDIKDQIDGFYKIFDYIAKNVYYDFDSVKMTKIINQNLIGPVLYGKSVCEGYSKFLQQMLSLIGIDALCVQGGGKKEEGGHIWNQVLIDGKWYDSDVTADSYRFHNNEEMKSQLVCDDAICYKTYSAISHICDENYKRDNSRK